MAKARITYRFDHTRAADGTRKPGAVQEDKVIPLFQEEFQVVEDRVEAGPEANDISKEHSDFTRMESLFESHSLNSFTADFGTWSSPIESESERVERIIRGTRHHTEELDVEPGIGSEPKTESASDQWSTYTNQGPWPEPPLRTRYSRSTGPHWFRIATSIAGAVITGVAFGFFVLSMFSSNSGDVSDPASKTAQTAVAKNTQTKTDTTAPTQGTDNKPVPVAANTNTANAAAVSIAGKSYSFVQSGVFSTQQSADAAQADLKKKGLGSAIEQSDKITVFAGFAASRDDALAISQLLKEKKLEVYIKNMDIPAVTSIKWTGSKPEILAAYISQGDKLIRLAAGLTTVHLAETKPTALDEPSLQAVKTTHQGITALAATVGDGASADSKSLVQKMATSLNSTVQSMEEYKKNPSSAMLWQAQSSMMQYIIMQKALLLAISG
jgi:stage II sporulation protein B